jgi:hypothetical protein
MKSERLRSESFGYLSHAMDVRDFDEECPPFSLPEDITTALVLFTSPFSSCEKASLIVSLLI